MALIAGYLRRPPTSLTSCYIWWHKLKLPWHRKRRDASLVMSISLYIEGTPNYDSWHWAQISAQVNVMAKESLVTKNVFSWLKLVSTVSPTSQKTGVFYTMPSPLKISFFSPSTHLTHIQPHDYVKLLSSCLWKQPPGWLILSSSSRLLKFRETFQLQNRNGLAVAEFSLESGEGKDTEQAKQVLFCRQERRKAGKPTYINVFSLIT